MQFSAVIPTLGGRASLGTTLRALEGQTVPPVEIVLVVAPAAAGQTGWEAAADVSGGRIPLRVVRSLVASAARQRNAGAAAARSERLLFIDDDILPAPDACERLLEAMEQLELSAVSGRMRGAGHTRPRGLLRLYYRLQAGFPHPTWGAMVLGPAICTLPCYDHDLVERDVIRSQWLPSGMLLVRRDRFESCGGFPGFSGYSALEDVHLTARLAGFKPQFGPATTASTGQGHEGAAVGFHTAAWFDHTGDESTGLVDPAGLARMRMANRWLVAREVMGQRGFGLWWRFQLLKVFDTVALARQRNAGWLEEIRGTWGVVASRRGG